MGAWVEPATQVKLMPFLCLSVR